MALHRWLSVIVVLGCSVACSQNTGGPVAAQTKEKRKMAGLVIGTFPKVRAVLPGESLPTESVFENRGAVPVDLPSGEGPSPFAYELLVEKDRTVRYVV